MPLHFFPPPENDEKEIRKRARDAAKKWIRPTVIEDDERAFFRREIFKALAQEGLSSILVPRQYGGHGLSHRCYYACLEEIARASASCGLRENHFERRLRDAKALQIVEGTNQIQRVILARAMKEMME